MAILFRARHWTVLSLALWLAAGSSLAQETSGVERADATGTRTAEAAGAETGSTEVMPAALRAPAIDFFTSGPSLQAHKLRGLRAEVAGLILGGQPGGDIAFEALATPLRGAGGKAHVPLFVEIDGPSFLEANQSSTARVEVYAYALTADQQVADFVAEAFAVDVQGLGEAVWQSGLKYYGHLELPAGEYRLRIVVRNFQSAAAALREMELQVPPFEALRQPFVFPVFRPPAARDAWLPVREWQAPAEYPLWIGEQALSPAVRPVLIAGRRSEAHALTYGLPDGAIQGRIELSQSGQAIATASLEVAADRTASGAGELDTVAIAFDLPQMQPGVYSLRLELAGAASSPVPVVVLQHGARDRGLRWTDLRGQLGGRREEATATLQKEPEQRVGRAAKREEQRRVRRLAERFRQALALLGQESPRSAARSALLDLESSVLTDGTLQSLKSAQLTVAEQLAAADVESLIPVLILHDELYALYRRRSLYSLGFHARGMVELLAELYAERGGTRGSHVVAARALASLGGHLQAANLPSSSRRLYRRALEHDPANRAALLGLATSYERYGNYSEAISVLEDLVAAHPISGEGLLRLAVNLHRLGVTGRARSLTEQVLELKTPDWVRSLAHQKLSRTLIATGSLEQAAELLEACLEENPQQHGSVYLLAHVYDRQRQPYKSLELLQTLAPTQAPSARKRYDSWPETALEAMRRELSGAAAARAELVARILAGAPGE